MKKRKNVDGAKRHSRKNGTTLQPDAIFHTSVVSRRSPLLEKMAPPYNLASFSSKPSPFYFETLRTHGIHIFFTFPKLSLDLLSCFQCLHMEYHLGKHGIRFCSWRKGIFLGEGPLVGGSSSTSNLKTCYNFNLCNTFYNILKAF